MVQWMNEDTSCMYAYMANKQVSLTTKLKYTFKSNMRSGTPQTLAVLFALLCHIFIWILDLCFSQKNHQPSFILSSYVWETKFSLALSWDSQPECINKPLMFKLCTHDLLQCFNWYCIRFLQYAMTSLAGCVAQWYNVGLWLANFPCPALDLQPMGEHSCG